MNARHVEDELLEYALGLLDATQCNAIEAHLRACDACQSEAKKTERVVDAMTKTEMNGDNALLRESANTQGDTGWERIEPHVVGVARFEHLLEKVASLFDLTGSRVREALARLDDPSFWIPGRTEGLRFATIEGGAKHSGSLVGFLAMKPGVEYPDHDHVGKEEVLVLQGGYADSLGFEKWRGESDERFPGTTHTLRALPGMECIVAAVLTNITKEEFLSAWA
ncbi:MAG: cupin domain-containing protein [Polyangiaceae bacterium]|nr:cupin domain-containing protein [Polyangiaceae bacterium]